MTGSDATKATAKQSLGAATVHTRTTLDPNRWDRNRSSVCESNQSSKHSDAKTGACCSINVAADADVTTESPLNIETFSEETFPAGPSGRPTKSTSSLPGAALSSTFSTKISHTHKCIHTHMHTYIHVHTHCSNVSDSYCRWQLRSVEHSPFVAVPRICFIQCIRMHRCYTQKICGHSFY